MGEGGIAVGPGANWLSPRWMGSNGRLCHRVFTAAATDAPVAAISPWAARAVRATPALVGACDGALQACLWRWGPPSGHWRLLGRGTEDSAIYVGSPPRSVALVLFAAGSRGGSRRGLCEWSGVRCDDGAGAAGDECGRTTPWGKSNPAVPTAGSVTPLDGEEGGKNASEERRGQEGAEQHRVHVARRLPGWAVGGGRRSPARRRWCCACLGPHQPHGTRSCDSRRPEHSVGQ